MYVAVTCVIVLQTIWSLLDHLYMVVDMYLNVNYPNLFPLITAHESALRASTNGPANTILHGNVMIVTQAIFGLRPR